MAVPALRVEAEEVLLRVLEVLVAALAAREQLELVIYFFRICLLPKLPLAPELVMVVLGPMGEEEEVAMANRDREV